MGKLAHLRLFFARATGLAGPILALYVLVGAELYGFWWYSFLWRRKFLEPAYWFDGALYLLEHHPSAIVLTLIGFILVLLTAFRRRESWLPWLDRNWWRLFVASSVALAFLVGVIYTRHNAQYLAMKNLSLALSRLGEAVDKIGELTGAPAFTDLIDFHFVDGARVNALYNQLQPEMEEQARQVGSRTTAGSSAQVGTRELGAEGHVNAESSAQSNLGRTPFSDERKCLVVIGTYSARIRRIFFAIRPVG